MTSGERPPNLILLVTDQQRAPQHWPADPAWLDALMPHDADLRRTGMTFTRAFIAHGDVLAEPGEHPHRHLPVAARGDADADARRPAPRSAPLPGRAAHRRAAGGRTARCHAEAPGTRIRAGGCCGWGPRSGNEPELPPGIDTLATLLRDRGYHVALKGKWHLTKPVNGDGWSAA